VQQDAINQKTLPSLYHDVCFDSNAAPFLFYYNPNRYADFMSGIKELCATVNRKDLFIASGGTGRSLESLDERLSDALDYCGGQYLDMFVIEYICPDELIEDSDSIYLHKVSPLLSDTISHVRKWVEKGFVRHVAISTHSHVVGAVLAYHSDVDALMLRYGMSHKDAAENISFPAARKNNKPVIAFTTTRWNSLQKGFSDGTKGPTVSDCVSFALAKKSSNVEVVLHSARDENELQNAIRGVSIGMNEDIQEKWRIYGKVFEDANKDHFDEYPEEQFKRYTM